MLSAQVPLALQLVQLSALYAKVSLDEPVSVSERIIDYCFDRKQTDNLYARERATGDEFRVWNMRRYWSLREPEQAAEKARAEAEAAKDARIAALEAELRDMRAVQRAGVGAGEVFRVAGGGGSRVKSTMSPLHPNTRHTTRSG